MRHGLGMLVIMGSLVLGSGCVERRMVINSDPPGALVIHNGQPLGAAPADDHFVYYGNHHFTLIKPGFETLHVDQKIAPVWYQYFPLDLFSEIFVPLQLEDVRRYTFQMRPLVQIRPEDVSNRAAILRERGKSIPSEAPEPPPPPPGAQFGPPDGAPVILPPEGTPPATPPGVNVRPAPPGTGAALPARNP
jgi:hypothetical protein